VAPKILEEVRKLELPLMLVFNRNRVMVLPQGINKATGLREVLNTMRLSLHNCIGIGDAENDHALLEACEIGVAVSWGSKSLKAIADDVLRARTGGGHQLHPRSDYPFDATAQSRR
jgi:hydroxymethylpyrimidine pyrophosphatase-like HAD family hydrolase